MKEEKKEPPEKKKKDYLQITELFGAKKGKKVGVTFILEQSTGKKTKPETTLL